MARQTTTDPQIAAALKRLDALAERAPDLAEPVAFYRAALPLMRDAQAGVESFALDAETAQRKLASGLPVLVGEDLPLDLDATRALFLRLVHIAETIGAPASRKRGWSVRFASRGQLDPLKLIERARNGDGTALRSAAARQIRLAVEQDRLDLAAVWEALALGDWRRVEMAMGDQHLDAELLRALAQNSLKPALRVWAHGLDRLVELDHWRRGQCPLCGSPPLLSEIQGKEGARRLRCGMCGAGWPYPRLQCAFCVNKDYKLLGYITVEGEEEKYSLQTCEVCHGYLKVVVTYDPIAVDLLSIEDLATLHLDLIANEHEFERVPVK